MTAAGPTDRQTPAPRRRLPRAERGEQLLDVAEALFALRGLEDTSMEDIARAAGVTRPVVYDHYPSKDELFLACVRRARAELEFGQEQLEEMLDSGATLEQVIERGGEVFFEILERDPRRWAVLFSPGVAPSADLARRLDELRAGTIARIADVAGHFAHDQESDRVAAYAYAVSGVGEQLGRWWLTRPEVTRAEVVVLYRDFIVHGISPLQR